LELFTDKHLVVRIDLRVNASGQIVWQKWDGSDRELTMGLSDLVSIYMVFAKENEGVRSKNPVINNMIFLSITIPPGKPGVRTIKS
jgi:hypothetical protein